MKIRERFSSIPDRIWILIFLGIFVLSGLGTYVTWTDTRLVEQKILAKQKEAALVMELRDVYETKRRAAEKGLQKADSKGMSLASVEAIVSKTLVGGRLAMLRPTTMKEEKGKQQAAVELRITNAPLGEIVSFLKAAETAGMRVKKLQLTLPQSNPSALDMHVIVTYG